jgi:hypothetical protein
LFSVSGVVSLSSSAAILGTSQSGDFTNRNGVSLRAFGASGQPAQNRHSSPLVLNAKMEIWKISRSWCQ